MPYKVNLKIHNNYQILNRKYFGTKIAFTKTTTTTTQQQ